MQNYGDNAFIHPLKWLDRSHILHLITIIVKRIKNVKKQFVLFTILNNYHIFFLFHFQGEHIVYDTTQFGIYFEIDIYKQSNL